MSGKGRVLKMVAVGDGAVGKTSLLVAYTQGAFDEAYVPTVFENFAGKITVKDKTYNFTLWDTAGQEGFDRCRVLCYPGTSVFLLCFSIDNRKSFENVKTLWLPEIRREIGDRVPILLVGTKLDLRDIRDPRLIVTKTEGAKRAKSLKVFNYVECSAKTMRGCDKVFEEAIKAAIAPLKAPSHCVML